jgi:hypothetical protein
MPDPLHSLVVHHPAVPAEQRRDAAIAIVPLLGGIANEGLSQPRLVTRQPGPITLGPQGLAKHQADAAFRHPKHLPYMLNTAPPMGRP